MAVPYEKFVQDGKVAVLYSPGWGAGWYSWNTEYEFLLFDRELVALVLEGKQDAAAELAKEKAPDIYTGGADDLTVEWLPVGAVFKIDEYDGNESVSVVGDDEYKTA